jgi:DNA polymerase III subunit alpha
MARRFLEPAQLHNHSKYSLLDAVPSPEEWVQWCLDSGTPGFAITDHGTAISMFDAIRFPAIIEEINKDNKEANKKDGGNRKTNYDPKSVVGIPAVELYVKLNKEDKSHYHITVWATSNKGYTNLMKLSSLAYNDTVSYYGNVKGRVTYDMLQEYKEGLKFGTGCIAGPIGQAVMHDDNLELAEERYLMYKKMFGDELYVEFHVGDVTHEFNKKTGGFDPFGPTCHCEDGNKQKTYNKFLASMIDKHGGKGIPVTDAHFIKPDDKIIQDCLLKNGNDNGWYFQESYHQFRADEMFDKLKVHLGDWLSEAVFERWIENTYEVMNAARTIDIKFDYHLPKIDIPAHIRVKTDDYDKQVYYLTMDKIKEHGRWNNDPIYVERFKKELDVIKDNATLNFLPYFLIYEDIGSHCRKQGILQNIARGSAGGSLLSYYLKIIHVDPIEANLPFERFLSHARIRAGSFPDIDADIGDAARPKIMQYLKDKYNLGFAQIATFNKMKTKNAIKDAMYALYGKNRNDPEVVAICNTIPGSPQGVDEHDFLYGFTDKEGTYHVGQVEVNPHLATFFQTHTEVEGMVKKLIGMPRGWSRHASAFVISTLDLSNSRVPTTIMKDAEVGDLPVTQYDAAMVEKCGLVKADILGIKTLTTVSDCLRLIKATTDKDYMEEDAHGKALIYRLPEDSGVYVDFYNKETDSSFQFTSDVIKGVVPDFAPTQRGHLSALTALMRPGAMDATIETDDGTITASNFYIKVRKGEADPFFIHPDLEPILKDTYGVIVYQEQVMEVLVKLCGYTLEETDIIRSAIAKKKNDVIQATFTRIREATAKRGWTPEQATNLCKTIEAFSRYSFNLSHSHAYAELGYITMYLKHHHKLEWWASVLNNEDDETKMRKFIGLLGPIVKHASLKTPTRHFTVMGNKIVAPISVIKGVGPAVVEELVSKGPFESVKDFCDRVNHSRVNIGSMSSLIKGRAADDLMDPVQLTGSYAGSRTKLMEDYRLFKKSKTNFKEDMLKMDPLSIFLQERDYNRCFNKNLTSDQEILNDILTTWPALKQTGRTAIPLVMKDSGSMEQVPVLPSIKLAEGLLRKNFEKSVGMVLLYEGSTTRSGVSKKSGKKWTLTSVKLSDGYVSIEATDWNRKSPLKWPLNSIVYVQGKLKEGWKTPVSINVEEIERIKENK